MKTKAILFLSLVFITTMCRQDQTYPYLNPKLPVNKRVADLVSRMTLEEKISQMMNSASAVDSLGIPEYNWWNECLHGVARAGVATVFPQAIGLSATWDTALMYRVADVISTEARAKYNDYQSKGEHGIYKGLTFWSPNINIFRDPRWGRGQETYGEDPFLTGRMAVEFVRGLQGDDPKYFKVIATPKHFAVHSGPEPDRHHFDVDVSDEDLWNTYLPAFEAAVVNAGAFSVMGAYNRFRGQSCSAHELLLGDILRNKWKFKGYVVSDCGAIRDIWKGHKIVQTPAAAAALGVKNGCDLNCGRTYEHLAEAVEKGLITEAEIDTAVTRLFTARFRLGMFDPPEMVPWSAIPISENNNPEHRELALQAARESLVLLKNENDFLPVNSGKVKKIAVIGPNAKNVDVLVGNYHGTPAEPVTLLDGIIRRLPKGVEVDYEPGCDLVAEYSVLDPIPARYLNSDGQQGLQGSYFKNMEMKGSPVLIRQDSVVAFEFGEGKMPEGVPWHEISVRWNGTLTPPNSGTYILGVTGDDGYRLYLDGEKIIDLWSPHGPVTTRKKVKLESDHKYQITLEYYQNKGGAMIELAWTMPGKDARKDALQLAASSDLVIFAGGISPRLEGEEMRVPFPGFKGGDRTSLKLPEVQENLLNELYATGTPVVLVNFSGSAIALNWENDHLPAIVQTWYPGQSGGLAVADVIFGNYNPAGRLPVTFYKSVNDLPPFTDYDMAGRTYRYFTGDVLYPFGFGLSFNQYHYENIIVSGEVLHSDQKINLSVDITNKGKYSGDEVVQLYVGFPESVDPRPVKTLREFRRISFKPGEKKSITFVIKKEMLSIRDAKGNKVTPPGNYTLMVGGNSENVLSVNLKVE
ncbi:MAG: glucan 1,4-alpha-glucosidase [Chlorobi bacterium]|nr:glucan 1,4-alpha-glucosidase [Chlorobiota bacterium]